MVNLRGYCLIVLNNILLRNGWMSMVEFWSMSSFGFKMDLDLYLSYI